MNLSNFIYLYQTENQYILSDLIEQGIIAVIHKNGETYYRSGYNNSTHEYLDFSFDEDKESLSDIYVTNKLFKLFGFKKVKNELQ